MKKTATIFKTMLMAAVVFVMAQGCVPTPPSGGPVPTNTFNVNISSSSGVGSNNNSQSKTLFIDDDSISFSTSLYIGSLGGASHDFIIRPISNSTYEYIANTQYAYNHAAPIEPNTSIGINDLDSIRRWVNVNNEIYFGGGTILFPSNILSSLLPYNADRYIVFRKLKQAGYQYYWVKIRYTNNIMTYTLSITNGRYQMNNITTGQ